MHQRQRRNAAPLKRRAVTMGFVMAPAPGRLSGQSSYTRSPPELHRRMQMQQPSALELARLHLQVVSVVSSSPWVRQGNVAEVCRLITEETAKLLGIERVGVWLFNEARDALVCQDLYLRSSGQHSSGAVLLKSEFEPEFTYLLNNKVVDAHDPYNDPRTLGYVEGYLKPNRISAMLDAVVRMGHELIGTVCFEHVDRPHHWSENEIVLASQLGDQVALALSISRSNAMAEQLKQRDRALNAMVDERTAALEATRTSLIQSERLASLGSIVAGVAHDLNSPVGNALLTANAMRERARAMQPLLSSGKLQRSMLEAFITDQIHSSELVERSLQRAAALVSAFKSVTADQASGARRHFELADLVRDVLEMLQPSLAHAACKVTVDLRIEHGLTLDSFPGALDQVLVNLVNNAVLHGFEGRETGRIELQAKSLPDGQVELVVIDDGSGIPAEHLPKVFDRFFTTKRGMGGSGLGMSLVASLVRETLGGSVSLDSALGQGCTVRLIIPQTAPASSNPP
jgi:two-component system, NtrC family, sensor kinase